MRLNRLKIIASCVLSSGLILGGNLAIAQISPPPEAITADSPRAMPVGQVDAAQPVEVLLMNNTAGTVAIGMPGDTSLKIEPADEIAMTFEQLPVRLFIYQFGQQANVEYVTEIEDNVITLEIVSFDSAEPGDRAFNVNRAGLVYKY